MRRPRLRSIGWPFLAGAVICMGLLAASEPVGAAEPKPIRIGHLGEWTGPAGRTCGPPGDAFIAYFHEYVNKEKGGIPYLDPKTGQVKGKVKVEVSLFGRPTSVELDYTQLKGY